MVSRDLVPMRERIAEPSGSGKPPQIAGQDVPGHNTEGDAAPRFVADALPGRSIVISAGSVFLRRLWKASTALLERSVKPG